MKKQNAISKHFSELGKKSWLARKKKLIKEARAKKKEENNLEDYEKKEIGKCKECGDRRWIRDEDDSTPCPECNPEGKE